MASLLSLIAYRRYRK
ncbi:hypothetical protein ABTC44_10545 [Acinetobacter baumannii]